MEVDVCGADAEVVVGGGLLVEMWNLSIEILSTPLDPMFTLRVC